jgi:acetate kinase
VRVLVVNAGSSSLKLRLLDASDAVIGRADLAAVGDVTPGDVAAALADLGPFDATGHRVVHGGEGFREPVLVDGEVRRALDDLTALAPLHQPKSLAALDLVTEAAPDVPAVACFDTAFHGTLAPAAATYAVPVEWRTRHGVRRYGFHGLSHAYASRRATRLVAAAGHPVRRIVTCHLGAGASLAAVLDGRSVDTTMGFTPLEGLAMATRSGTVDPGALLWLITHQGLAPTDVAEGLEHRSGLVALAGTADMAEVVARATGTGGVGGGGIPAAGGMGDGDIPAAGGGGDGDIPAAGGEAASGDEAAGLALAVYLHRLRAGIAAMAATLGGLDVLVFTGGVGENAPAVRAGAADALPFLGLGVDPAANAAVDVRAAPEADITAPGAAARVLVIAAREDLEIARSARARLTSG